MSTQARRDLDILTSDAERVPCEKSPFVRQLKASPEVKSVSWAAESLPALFEADLIDEVGANVHPILLARGSCCFTAPLDF